MSKRMALPGFEKTAPPKKQIHATSSRQSVRESIEQWRQLSANRRKSKTVVSGPTSVVNLVEVNQADFSGLMLKKVRGKSASSSQRNSIQPEKEKEPRVSLLPTEPQRTSNATRISINPDTNLYFHEPVHRSSDSKPNRKEK